MNDKHKPLGYCSNLECRTSYRFVFPGQPFDIVRLNVGGKRITTLFHRECNIQADHSRD